MGKRKKGVYPAPTMGQDTRLYTSLRMQKKERIPTAGFLQQRYPLYEVLLCLMGLLPSLRRRKMVSCSFHKFL